MEEMKKRMTIEKFLKFDAFNVYEQFRRKIGHLLLSNFFSYIAININL